MSVAILRHLFMSDHLKQTSLNELLNATFLLQHLCSAFSDKCKLIAILGSICQVFQGDNGLLAFVLLFSNIVYDRSALPGRRDAARKMVLGSFLWDESMEWTKQGLMTVSLFEAARLQSDLNEVAVAIERPRSRSQSSGPARTSSGMLSSPRWRRVNFFC
jgi:hypothetical protein